MSRNPLPIHPSTETTRAERQALGVWLGSRRKRGLPPACYGIWKVIAPQLFAQNRARFVERQPEAIAKAAIARRKRPEWCDRDTWRLWRAYQRSVASGIPLEDYADPVRRHVWLEKRSTRKLSPREAAAELLRRKGLAP